jgi:hypothetical protein
MIVMAQGQGQLAREAVATGTGLWLRRCCGAHNRTPHLLALGAAL